MKNRRIARRMLRLPSPATVIATVALIVATAGVAKAGSSFVSSKPQAAASVTPFITGAHVLDNSLTGADINEATLGQVPSAANATNATHATSATNATNAANAASLGGVPASGYTRRDCPSNTGQIKGYARVLASPTFSPTFTTAGVSGYNCSGGAIEALRVGQGHYRVRFLGTSLSQGIATSQAPGTSFNFNFVVMGQGGGTPPEFDVWIIHYDGITQDQAFNLVAFA